MADTPIIAASDVRFHWMTDWYDGPMAGLAIYKSRMHYFDLVSPEEVWGAYDEDGELNIPRKFNLYYLTDEQIAVWEQKHKAFQAMVGTHCDYNEDGKRDPKGRMIDQSREDFMKYYQIEWPDAKPDKSAIVGVFAEREETNANTS